MLRDASSCQVIQKFSFIESLSLSRARNSHSQSDLDKFNSDLALSFQPKMSNDGQLLTTNTLKKTSKPSAIVTTFNKATTIDSNWYQSTADYSLSLAEIIHARTDSNYLESNLRASLNSSARNSYGGKMLFALACSYSLFVMWWLFGYQGRNLLTAATGGRNIVLSKSEVKFIDYMERSLEQIDRQVAANKKTNDRLVYVPVYTPNTPAPTTLPISSSNIPLASSSSSIPVPSPQLAPAEPLAIPEPPPLPAPTPIKDDSHNSVQSNQVAIASKANITHTLVGVLELGGDSAALVKVQGQTKRVWVGEEINEGWVLESIANQHANINYQGQIRSISVGETF